VQNPDGSFSGKFGGSADDGNSPISGRFTGTTIEFTRTILPAKQNQVWKAELTQGSGTLKMINGAWSGYGFAGEPDFHAEKVANSAR
jgi:hypothetical protein